MNDKTESEVATMLNVLLNALNIPIDIVRIRIVNQADDTAKLPIEAEIAFPKKYNNELRRLMEDEAQIAFIIERFDFEKVHAIMNLLDWKWGQSQSVPTIQELRQASSDLMTKLLVYDTPVKISSGGFVAEKYFTEEGSFIGLYFKAVEFSSEWYDEEDL